MCEKAIKKGPWSLEFVPDHLKTQEMCEKAVDDELDTLEFVPDHFKTEGCVKGPLKKVHTP